MNAQLTWLQEVEHLTKISFEFFIREMNWRGQVVEANVLHAMDTRNDQ